MEYQLNIKTKTKKQAKKLLMIMAEIGYDVSFDYEEPRTVCFMVGKEELPFPIQRLIKEQE
jgi:hypothetical protein